MPFGRTSPSTRDSSEDLETPRAGISEAPSGGWRRRLLACGVFLLAVTLGLIFHEPIGRQLAKLIPPPQPSGRVLYWVSPHDPTFRSDKPGKDAMGMDLVPVYAGQKLHRAPHVIDPVLQEDEVITAAVEKGSLVRTINSVGTVTYAEPLIGDVTLKVDGWLERLHVDYLGQPVRKGDPLFEVYSPQLIASLEDYLISLEALTASESGAGPDARQAAQQNVESARQRLHYMDLTDQQIDEVARARKVPKTMTFYSPFDGIVTRKMVFDGQYMKAGSMLYRIADLSKVWAYFYIYQNEIHCVYEGQGATMTLANLPGYQFQGKVVYVYPYLEPRIRAVKVRVEFDNPELLLKPDMFVQVELEPHHMGVGLKLPQQAILDTGTRQLVYVALPENKFRAREVTTGIELDEGYLEILSGLAEGERVVTSGQFLLDSESRLRLVDRKFEEPSSREKPQESGSE